MKVMRKVFFDFNKEEAWLNQMSQEGYALVAYKSGKYYFEPSQEIYHYKIAINSNWKGMDKKDYLEFLESTGIRVLGTYNDHAYLARPAAEGELELYSDHASKIKEYQKASKPFAFICIMQVAFILFLLVQCIFYIKIFSPAFWALVVTMIFLSVLLFPYLRVLLAYTRRIKELKTEQSIEL